MDSMQRQKILNKQKVIYSSFTDEQLRIVNEYCRDNMKILKKVCYKRIRAICGDSNMDEDDLFSIAMDVLIKSVKVYDESKGSFDTFLFNNIYKKIDTYIRDTKYRTKRSNVQKDQDGKATYIPDAPLDALTDDGVDLAEKVASDFNIEDNLSEEIGFSLEKSIQNYSPVMQEYLQDLSRVQLKVLELMNQGYHQKEIQDILHITKELYKDSIAAITSKKATRKIERLLRGYKNVR